MTVDGVRQWRLCYETNNYSSALAGYFTEPVDNMPTLQDQLGAAASSGFTHVGLDMGSIRTYLEAGGSAAALSAELVALGLQCLEVAELSITGDERSVQDAAPPLIEIAAAVEARYIQISVFGELRAAAASLRRLESLLTGSDILVALEFLPFSPVCSISAARSFIRMAGAQRTRIVVDNWHFFHGPGRWAEFDGLDPDEIAYVQFSDHPAGAGDNLLAETVNSRRLPGDGDLDLRRFRDSIVKTGFSGIVSVEVLSDAMRKWDPMTFAGAEYVAARRYWPGS